MAGKSQVMTSSAAIQTAAQSMQVRQDILANSIPVFQSVKSGSPTYAYGSPTTVNILASNTGLIRRFFLEISGTFNCASSHTLTPTTFGLANILSNVQFTDQNNRLRINTSGIHLHLASTERRHRPFGAAMVASTGFSDTTGMGFNFPVMQAPSTVAGGTAKNFTVVFEIPVVNSNQDLSGAIYANQTTSNNQLQFTLNPNMFEYNGDPFNAAFSTDAALATALPTLTSLKYTLYQDFLDQLPVDNSGFAVLPQQDINWAVSLQNINLGVQVAGQDNLYALPPFNVYQSLMLFWDNYTYNGTVGGDVTYIKTQISNTYVLRQWDPSILAVLTRNNLGVDMPGAVGSAGFSGAVYALNFRHKPLSVNQVSSTNIVFNPGTVESGAALNMGQEYLWLANTA